MQQVLRDRDVDQRGVDIPVAEVGREERQTILRVDARPVPFEDPVHDHRVPQVVQTRSRSPLRWLQPGAAYNVNEQPGDGLLRVAGTPLLVPEQPGPRILRCADPTPCIDIGLKFGHHSVGQRQDFGLVELGQPDRDRAALKINIPQIEAGNLAPP